MGDTGEIARLMRKLEDQLMVCMRCGMCQAACPVFQQTAHEADVTRGKLALLDGLLHKMLQDPKGVSRRLNRCLLCGSCAANCPSGVKVLDIFLKARTIISGYEGLSPAKRLILRGMLARPDIFDRISEWAGPFQTLFSRPANHMIGTSCARIAPPLIGGRHFRPLARVPFHRRTPSKNTPAGKTGKRAALFVGCLIDKIFPEIADSVIAVLSALGVGLYLPQGQGCCGIPALSAGDRNAFLRLLHHNLPLFEAHDTDVLVTACATCTAAIQHLWPAMVSDQPAALQERVRHISQKAIDISAFVSPLIPKRPDFAEASHMPTPVTVHDPCHLKKSLGIWEEPRQLIEANPNYTLVEMAEPDTCCGMGGSFNLQHYDISCRIGDLKKEQILATKAPVVATGCPACMLQISDLLSRAGASMRVCHPIAFYAELVQGTVPTKNRSFTRNKFGYKLSQPISGSASG